MSRLRPGRLVAAARQGNSALVSLARRLVRRVLLALAAWGMLYGPVHLVPSARGEGLSLLRDEVRVPAPPRTMSEPMEPAEPAESRRGSSGGSWSDDDNGLGTDLIMLGLFGVGVVAATPIWAPIKATGDNYSVGSYFSRYPYRHGWDGYMMPDEGPEYCSSPQNWAGRVTLEYGTDFGDIERTGASLLIGTASRWGVDAQWSSLREQLPGDGVDELFIGDANIVFRFAQCRTMQWRTGLGVAWLEDRAGTDWGFNFTYGVDFYPCQPWIFSGEIDYGTLGEEERFHGRVSVGVEIRAWELYAGYDYYKVGGAEIEGPMFGLRFWF